MIGLAEAKRLGYPVAPLVIQRAQRIVRSRLMTPTLQAETWRLNRQAFLLNVLAASGAPDIAHSKTLFERRALTNWMRSPSWRKHWSTSIQRMNAWTR